MGVVQQVVDDLPQCGETALDAVLQGLRPGEDRLEEEVHDGEEDDGPRHRVQQHPVDGGRGAVLVGRLEIRRLQDRVRPGGEFGWIGGRGDGGGRPGGGVGQALAQFGDADAAVAQDAYRRDAQGASQGLDVEMACALGELVGHGDDQAGGQAQLERLGQEGHAPAQCRGVQDDDEGVRRLDGGVVAVQDLAHDLLVGADRVQGVGAGQVLDGHARRGAALGKPAGADGARDRDPGVVAGLGAQAGQGVVDGGLAGVGGAGKGGPGCGGVDLAGGGAAVARGAGVA